MSRSYLQCIPVALAVVGLLVGLSGCQSLPKGGSSQASRPGDFDDDDEDSGRLFRYGQAAAQPEAPNAVRPASLDRSLSDTESDDQVVRAVVDAAETEEDGFELEDLDPVNVFRSMRDAAGYGPDQQIARDLYREGLELYQAKEYDAAAEKLTAAAKRWPDSTLEEDALFLAGESYFFADDYPDAQKAFEKLLKKHDYTHHLDTVTKRLFAMARYWEKRADEDPAVSMPVNVTDKTRPWIDTVGYALKAYDNIRMYDPTGPLADDSVMATANLYFVRGRYEDAAHHYDLLRTEYTKSEHQLKAHLLAIESWQRIYQGGYYDSGPLEKAGEVADQALIQFGSELKEDRPRVVEAKNKIVEEMAARDWIIGQYYDKRKRYGAARFYYQAIIEEYPQTAAARKAEARLTEIADLPDKPKNRLKWFTDMFEREQY